MHARLVVGSLLCGALLASGCATHHAELADASIGGASRGTGLAVAARASAPAASAPVDRYVEMAGRKSDLGTAFVQTTPDMWGPYDLHVHTGFFDPEQKASPDQVRVCLEADDVGFDVTYLVCGQYHTSITAWQIFAAANGVTLTGSANIASDEIELRLEQTGGNVNFYGRAFGAMSWTPIATTPFLAQLDPHKTSFGVSSITKGTAVGFDGLSASFSAPAVPPTGGVAVAADVNAALIAAYNAHLNLDAGLDDFVTAGMELGTAEDRLDDAATGVAALPESKENQSAAKHIAKADKSLAKAQEQVADEDAGKALKTLGKVARSLIEAALLLNPQPFPPPAP